jgi:uncharacterized membrane protein required for colicin V production
MLAFSYIFNWFDLLTLAALVVGVNIGRHRGMSEELLDAAKWVTIVLVSGSFYAGPGASLAAWMKMTPSTGFVFFYLLFGFGVWKAFGWIKLATGDKLFGRDTFGDWEYPLGMLAGGIRAICMMGVAMALLNSVYVSDAELERAASAQRESFGAISFPTLGSIQQQVFKGSMAGRYTKGYFNRLLVAATPPYEREPVKVEGMHKEREELVDQALGKK